MDKDKMLKIAAGSAIVLVIGAGLWFGINNLSSDKPGDQAKDQASVSSVNNDKIVAMINGEPVTYAQANLRMHFLEGNNQNAQDKNANYESLSAEVKKFVINEEAAHRLIVSQAIKEKVLPKEELDKNIELFKESLLRKVMLQKIANTSLSEEKLRKVYDEESKKIIGQDEIKAEHILVATEEEAKELKEKLTSENFSKMAKEKSLDKKSAQQGGDLGVLYTGNMLPEFEAAIKDLNKNEISEPIKTKFGWHLVKLISRKPAKILSYDEVKDKIAFEVSREEITKYVNNLLKDTKIELK